MNKKSYKQAKSYFDFSIFLGVLCMFSLALLFSILFEGCSMKKEEGKKKSETIKIQQEEKLDKEKLVGTELKKAVINLNKEELGVIGKETEDIKAGLLSKAIFNEAISNKKMDKKALETIAERSIADYFIDITINKKITVKPEEVKEVYEKNKKDLNGKTLEEVSPRIQKLIYQNKYERIKSEVVEDISRKYKIKSSKDEDQTKFITDLYAAAYKEALQNLKSPEEKLILEFIKRKAINSYYLTTLADEKVKVTKKEIKEVYEQNKKKLQGKTLEDTSESIKGLIQEKKGQEEVNKIMTELSKKYKIGEKVKKLVS